MMNSKPARLKVILGENNVEKLTLPDGIPQSSVELVGIVKKTFGLVDIRLQYMDEDFGHEFFNLNSTCDLKDMGTIKVVQLNVTPLTIMVANEEVAAVLQGLDDSSSVASNDTVLVSSPESVPSRTEQWPRKFLIRRFSYETEVQLEQGNAEYHTNKKMLSLRTKAKSDILNGVIEDIYRYTAYPTDAHFCEAAEALIEKHPCLKEPGSYNGAYGWKQRFKYKMGNYRTELKGLGCAELCLNSQKATPNKPTAKGVKRPRRAEANFYPSLPMGETNETMEKERQEIITERNKRNTERVVKQKMAHTFPYRRQEIVNTEPSVCDLQDRWPALFEQQEINEEFQRLVAIPLETKFFAQLDKYGTALMALARSKGGQMQQKMAPIIHSFDQTEDIHVKRECTLKALITLLGEDASNLIKDCNEDDVPGEWDLVTMAVFSVRPTGFEADTPENIGVILEGNKILNGLTSVTSGCALLLGLIYILNMAYPMVLRYTFEAFQKIFMELDVQKMTPKVHSLLGKLQSAE